MNTPPIAIMRPQTPDFNFAQQAPPSSPPETPTSPTFHFGRRSRRHGMHFPGPPLPPNGQIKAHGNGPHFSYNPSLRPEDLSPRSSSPSSESSGSPPRSLASSVRSTSSEPEPAEREHTPPRIITSRANFTLEEMTESDFEDYDSDDEDIIRPYHYEDAESDHAHSLKEPTTEIDPRVLKGFKDLACEEEAEMDAEAEREAWVEAMRAEKRRKRRSSSSVQKRTISQSIGSDTDDEDMVAPQLDADEAGSTARRLRRKTDRSSLIFDDPPPRIDELEEPESCEEIVEVNDDDDMIRALPYWRQEMDVDSDDE